MGLNQRTSTNRTFVSIVAGKFAQRTTEDHPDSVRRVITDKKTKAERIVWELIYDDLDGFIQGIEIKEDGSFGDQLNINMEDEGKFFTISLSMAGREAKGFLCCLKNINLAEKIILAPYNFTPKDDGRQVIGMNTYQGGRGKDYKVAPYFSKDQPNGLPQVPEGSDKDEFKLAMKQQEIYLKKWAKKFIADHFADQPQKQKMEPNPAAAAEPSKPAKTEKEKIYDNASVPSDDLPF